MWLRTLLLQRGKEQRKIFSVDSPVRMNVIIITTQPWRGYSFLTNAEGTLVMVEEVQLCRKDWIWGIHTPEYIELAMTFLFFCIFLCLHVSCLHRTAMEKKPPYTYIHKHTLIYIHISSESVSVSLDTFHRAI